MRWNRIADDSLDRSWNRNWKWNCDLEYAPQAHGQEWQERQDSDYECAARDFQLSPNYVSNSYEIAKDFWVDEVKGKGHGCVPDTFAARRWRNFQKICNRNTQRWPDVLRCRIRYTRMWYTLYVRYMLYAVCHQGLMRHPFEAIWKYLKTTAAAGSRHSLDAQNRFYTEKSGLKCNFHFCMSFLRKAFFQKIFNSTHLSKMTI